MFLTFDHQCHKINLHALKVCRFFMIFLFF